MSTIRKRGTKWQVQIRRKGFDPLTRSFTSKADAREWARHQEVLADRQDLPQNKKTLDALTLRDLVIRYRDEVTPTKRGAEIETVVLDAFLRETICSKRLSDLTQADFANYRDRRRQKVTKATIGRQLSPLHHMFEKARDEWNVPLQKNPLERVAMHAVARRRDRRLRDGEMDWLIESAKKCRNSNVLPTAIFSIETAMRRGELLALRWTDVDLKNRLVKLPQSKNGHPRTIPLSLAACALLRGLPREGEAVFAVSANALKLSWARLVKRANIADLHFHDLRHEAISRFFELGLTLPEVSSISGHRDIRMLLRYAHAERQNIFAKMDKITTIT